MRMLSANLSAITVPSQPDSRSLSREAPRSGSDVTTSIHSGFEARRSVIPSVSVKCDLEDQRGLGAGGMEQRAMPAAGGCVGRSRLAEGNACARYSAKATVSHEIRVLMSLTALPTAFCLQRPPVR